jgi:hypothetical protein
MLGRWLPNRLLKFQLGNIATGSFCGVEVDLVLARVPLAGTPCSSSFRSPRTPHEVAIIA